MVNNRVTEDTREPERYTTLRDMWIGQVGYDEMIQDYCIRATDRVIYLSNGGHNPLHYENRIRLVRHGSTVRIEVK